MDPRRSGHIWCIVFEIDVAGSFAQLGKFHISFFRQLKLTFDGINITSKPLQHFSFRIFLCGPPCNISYSVHLEYESFHYNCIETVSMRNKRSKKNINMPSNE